MVGWDLFERAYSHSKDGLWCLSKIGSEEKLLNLEVIDWMKGINGGKDSSGETGQEAVARVQVMET